MEQQEELGGGGDLFGAGGGGEMMTGVVFSEKNQLTVTLCDALDSLQGWLPKGPHKDWESMIQKPGDLETWRATRGSLETLYVVDVLESVEGSLFGKEAANRSSRARGMVSSYRVIESPGSAGRNAISHLKIDEADDYAHADTPRSRSRASSTQEPLDISMLEDLGIVGMMGGLGVDMMGESWAALPRGLPIVDDLPFDPYAPMSAKEQEELEKAEKHIDTPMSPSRELKEDS